MTGDTTWQWIYFILCIVISLFIVTAITYYYEKPIATDDDDYTSGMGDDNFINDRLDDNKEAEQSEAIKFLMEYLNQRERNIITKYYGLDGNKPKTLEEIGMEYGLTKERIRQIKNTSFKKMRSVALSTGMTANVF